MRVCRKCFKHHDDQTRVCDVDATETVRCPQLISPTQLPAGTIAPGTVIGNYRLLGLLGVGGMGLVYLAEHSKLRRMVALKLLRSELATDEVTRARFFAEARAANAIRHENIIEITDFIDEAPHRYFVMEVLEGESLKERMSRGSIPLPRAVHIARQLAGAVHAAHDVGVIHRDLKPANVQLIRRGGDPDVVKVLDFGIAKLSGDMKVDEAQTLEGQLLGTPAYMAPEQPKQEPVDHRTDIYSFGALMFHVLTGRPPFTGAGNLASLLIKVMNDPAPRPNEMLPADRQIPPELEALLLKCLEKDPKERPQNMGEVESALADVAAVVGPPPPVEVSNPFLQLANTNSGVSTRPGDPSSNPAAATVDTASTHVIERNAKPMSEARSRNLRVAAGASAVGLIVVAAAFVLTVEEPAPEEPVAPRVIVKKAPSAVPVVQKVQVAFASNPPGGQVFLASAAQPLGVTPFVHEFEPGQLPVRVEFRLDGTAPVEEEVTADRKLVEAVFAVPNNTGAKGKLKSKATESAGNGGEQAELMDFSELSAEERQKQLKKGALVDPFAEE